jgi:aspartate racemase
VRTIGLLGGMSWVSTAHCYELINRDVVDRFGGDHCAPMVLWQADFDRITALQRAGEWGQAGELLADGAAVLVRAGAEVVGICANTMHLVADAVAGALGDGALVHIVDVVRDECLARGVTRLGLLGTAYTMESPDLYPARLAAAGIDVLVPDAPERDVVQRITFEELIHDVVTDSSRAEFRRIGAALVDSGAEAIVLACTEHGAMLGDADLDVPVLDSTVLHARALVDAAVAGSGDD